VQTLLTQTDPVAHCVQVAPQFAPVVFVSGAQVLFGHRWNVALHAGTHEVPLQVTVPFAGCVQVVHDGPQAATVSLAMQVGAAAVPRRQKPGVLQTTRQLSVPGLATLSHAAAPLAGGAAHAVHDEPHDAMLLFATQAPVPAGQ